MAKIKPDKGRKHREAQREFKGARKTGDVQDPENGDVSEEVAEPAPVKEENSEDVAPVERSNAPAAVDVAAMDSNTMDFPGDESEDKDVPHPKDELVNVHKYRLGSKRRFIMDALCRALGTEFYKLEVDKAWAPNPLGKGPNINVRYTREFPGKFILFDKFPTMPPERILEFKRKLAHEHGFKYIYETPEKVLTHDRLDELLDEQRHITHEEEALRKSLSE